MVYDPKPIRITQMPESSYTGRYNPQNFVVVGSMPTSEGQTFTTDERVWSAPGEDISTAGKVVELPVSGVITPISLEITHTDPNAEMYIQIFPNQALAESLKDSTFSAPLPSGDIPPNAVVDGGKGPVYPLRHTPMIGYSNDGSTYGGSLFATVKQFSETPGQVSIKFRYLSQNISQA